MVPAGRPNCCTSGISNGLAGRISKGRIGEAYIYMYICGPHGATKAHRAQAGGLPAGRPAANWRTGEWTVLEIRPVRVYEIYHWQPHGRLFNCSPGSCGNISLRHGGFRLGCNETSWARVAKVWVLSQPIVIAHHAGDGFN